MDVGRRLQDGMSMMWSRGMGDGGGVMPRAASADWPPGSGSALKHTRHTGGSDSDRAGSVVVTESRLGEDAAEVGASVVGGKSRPWERGIVIGCGTRGCGAGERESYNGGTDDDESEECVGDTAKEAIGPSDAL